MTSQQDLKKCQPKVLKTKNERHFFFNFNLLVWTEIKIQNNLINSTHGCQCSVYVDGYAVGMLLFCYSFGTVCGDIKFAVVTRTAISCSLSRQYRPILSLYFLDVYGVCFQNFLDVKQNRTPWKYTDTEYFEKSHWNRTHWKILLEQNTEQ